MLTKTTASGLHTVAEVATALSTSERAVLRLIARGQIKAISLPPSVHAAAEWRAMDLRVTDAELQRYLAAGAPDVTPPEWEAGWFADREYVIAQNCAQSISKACDSQILSNEQVLSRYSAALAKTKNPTAWDVNRAASQEVTLAATDAVKTAAGQSISNLYGWISTRYSNQFAALCVSRLRGFARDAMGSGPSLERLYSPEYGSITTAALDAMKAAPCAVFTKATPIPAGISGAGGTISVTYRLPFSAFVLGNVVDQAF